MSRDYAAPEPPFVTGSKGSTPEVQTIARVWRKSGQAPSLTGLPAHASPFSEADVPHAIEHKPKRDPKLEILNLSLYPDERQYTVSAASS